MEAKPILILQHGAKEKLMHGLQKKNGQMDGQWLPMHPLTSENLLSLTLKTKHDGKTAFNFLKNTDLTKLDLKRYDIDGDNLFATVSEYISKNEETTNFEAHRKYIDIQYVISGKELMNIAPVISVKEVITPYDAAKDIEFVKVSKIVNYKATPSNFFIFFPDDAHRPGLKDGVNSPVRKVVIKLKVD